MSALPEHGEHRRLPESTHWCSATLPCSLSTLTLASNGDVKHAVSCLSLTRHLDMFNSFAQLNVLTLLS